MKIKRIATLTVLLLVVAELILVLTSWLLSATMTEGVRSLLSDVGIRWFLGSLTTFIATPWLVRLLLLAMAGGCFWQSGVFRHSPWRWLPLLMRCFFPPRGSCSRHPSAGLCSPSRLLVSS